MSGIIGLNYAVKIKKNQEKWQTIKTKSWVRNQRHQLSNLLSSLGFNRSTAGNLTFSNFVLKNLGGIPHNYVNPPPNILPPPRNNFELSRNFLHKIGIGRDNTPESPDDVNLINLIKWADTYFKFTEGLENDRPAFGLEGIFDITADDTIAEVGLLGWEGALYDSSEVGGTEFLLARDLVNPPLVIHAGDTISVRYKLRVV
ncbi:MAG: hypothetical protein KIH08_15895 [Candidatus Freyarchaeota archaeon]|nr:hypothetical protein [Candidatus Jordarchaeia archaeon]